MLAVIIPPSQKTMFKFSILPPLFWNPQTRI
jgi:hypothetical protein